MIAFLFVAVDLILSKNCANKDVSFMSVATKGNCYYTLGCMINYTSSTCVECKSVTSESDCGGMLKTCVWEGKCKAQTCSGAGDIMVSEMRDDLGDLADTVNRAICSAYGCTYRSSKKACGVSTTVIVVIIVVVIVVVVVAIVVFIVVYIIIKKKQQAALVAPLPPEIQALQIGEQQSVNQTFWPTQSSLPPSGNSSQNPPPPGGYPPQNPPPPGGYPPQQNPPPPGGYQGYYPSQGGVPPQNPPLPGSYPPQNYYPPQGGYYPQSYNPPQGAPQTQMPQAPPAQ